MKDNLTQIVLILDRSGSMSSIEDATVEGVNAFLAEQKRAPGEAAFYFVQFDDIYEKVYEGLLENAPHLTLAKVPSSGEHRFEPRGWTALLDAIGITIDDLGKRLETITEAERPGKVVVTIMTDGQENRSKKFSQDRIAEMIALQRDVYQWQFQYLGANQDAIKEAGKYNILAANAVQFANSTRGTGNVIRAASAKVSNYRATGQAVTMGFFDEDRSRAMESDDPADAKP